MFLVQINIVLTCCKTGNTKIKGNPCWIFFGQVPWEISDSLTYLAPTLPNPLPLPCLTPCLIFIGDCMSIDLKTFLNQLKVSQSLEVYGASLRVCMSVCTRVFTKGLRSLKISQQIIAQTKTKHTFYQIKK